MMRTHHTFHRTVHGIRYRCTVARLDSLEPFSRGHALRLLAQALHDHNGRDTPTESIAVVVDGLGRAFEIYLDRTNYYQSPIRTSRYS